MRGIAPSCINSLNSSLDEGLGDKWHIQLSACPHPMKASVVLNRTNPSLVGSKGLSRASVIETLACTHCIACQQVRKRLDPNSNFCKMSHKATQLQRPCLVRGCNFREGGVR